MDADAQPGVIVAKTAGEEAAEAAAARGGFRTPPERPQASGLAQALAEAQAAEQAAKQPAEGRPHTLSKDCWCGPEVITISEADVAADLGAIDPAAVPSVQRPDGAPGFTEQYAGAKLSDAGGLVPNIPPGEIGAPRTQDAPLRTPPQRRNPTSGRILTEADRIIHSDRAEQYGPAEQSFDRIAAFWTTHLRDKLKPGAEVDGYDVALLMVLMKVSRAATDVKDDTFVDIAGYGALAARLAIFTGRGAA
jgi:hypothetical protein